jgi:hypothetical protein
MDFLGPGAGMAWAFIQDMAMMLLNAGVAPQAAIAVASVSLTLYGVYQSSYRRGTFINPPSSPPTPTTTTPVIATPMAPSYMPSPDTNSPWVCSSRPPILISSGHQHAMTVYQPQVAPRMAPGELMPNWMLNFLFIVLLFGLWKMLTRRRAPPVLTVSPITTVATTPVTTAQDVPTIPVPTTATNEFLESLYKSATAEITRLNAILTAHNEKALTQVQQAESLQDGQEKVQNTTAEPYKSVKEIVPEGIRRTTRGETPPAKLKQDAVRQKTLQKQNDEKMSSLLSQVNKLTEEVQNKDSELDSVKKVHSTFQDQLSRKIIENHNLLRQFEEKNEEIANLTAQLTASQDNVQKITAEWGESTKLGSDCEEQLQKQLQEEQEEIERLTSIIANLKEKTTGLEESERKAKNLVTVFEKEIKSLDSQIADLEKKATGLGESDQNVKSLTIELEETKTKLETALNDLETANKKKAGLLQSYATASKNLNEEKTKTKALQKAHANTIHQVKMREKDIQEARDALIQTKERAKKLEAKVGELEVKADELKMEKELMEKDLNNEVEAFDRLEEATRKRETANTSIQTDDVVKEERQAVEDINVGVQTEQVVEDAVDGTDTGVQTNELAEEAVEGADVGTQTDNVVEEKLEIAEPTELSQDHDNDSDGGDDSSGGGDDGSDDEDNHDDNQGKGGNGASGGENHGSDKDDDHNDDNQGKKGNDAPGGDDNSSDNEDNDDDTQDKGGDQLRAPDASSQQQQAPLSDQEPRVKESSTIHTENNEDDLVDEQEEQPETPLSHKAAQKQFGKIQNKDSVTQTPEKQRKDITKNTPKLTLRQKKVETKDEGTDIQDGDDTQGVDNHHIPSTPTSSLEDSAIPTIEHFSSPCSDMPLYQKQNLSTIGLRTIFTPESLHSWEPASVLSSPSPSTRSSRSSLSTTRSSLSTPSPPSHNSTPAILSEEQEEDSELDFDRPSSPLTSDLCFAPYQVLPPPTPSRFQFSFSPSAEQLASRLNNYTSPDTDTPSSPLTPDLNFKPYGTPIPSPTPSRFKFSFSPSASLLLEWQNTPSRLPTRSTSENQALSSAVEVREEAETWEEGEKVREKERMEIRRWGIVGNVYPGSEVD